MNSARLFIISTIHGFFLNLAKRERLGNQHDHINIASDRKIPEEDVRQFSIFYDKYSAAVYNTAMVFTKGDQSLCEDIVQLVFMRMWENRTKPGTLEKPEHYLYILARNIIFDTFKARARQLHHQLQLGELLHDGPDSPIKILAAKEYSGILKQAVETLTPQQRIIFQLAKESGIPHADIAEQMGISIQTVRTHLKLATRAVRHYVMAHIEDPEIIMILLVLLMQ
ncbi:sigma-70 family RNA polymerase sigma factor [Chitinophaga ginsengisegetis]